MVKTRVVKDVSGTFDLCETYSDEERKLFQPETGITYDTSVIDVIDHYENGEPKSRFLYEETDDLSDKALEELGGIGDDTDRI